MLFILKTVMGFVHQDLEMSQVSQKTCYDRHAGERYFNIGDLVLELIPVKNKKMQDCWGRGTFQGDRVNEVTYIMKPHGREAVQTVYVHRLKAYYGREMLVNDLWC